MTTVFIIRGYDLSGTATDPVFDDMTQQLEDKGYRVHRVDISWLDITISQYLEKFVQIYEKEKTYHNIIIGSSLGAIVTVLAAPIVNPNKVVVSSLSPYWKENYLDVPGVHERGLRKFGPDLTDDAGQNSWRACIQNLIDSGVEHIFTYGELEKTEYPWLPEFNKKIESEFSEIDLREIPGAPHSLHIPVHYQDIVNLL